MVIYFVIVMWYFQVMVSCGKVSSKTTLFAVDFLLKSTESIGHFNLTCTCLLLPCRWDASHSAAGAADGAEAEPAAVRPLQGPSGAERGQPAHAAAAAADTPAARQRPHGLAARRPAAPTAAASARGASSPAADPGEDPAPERAPDGRSASSAAAAAGATSHPRAGTGAQPSVAAASCHTAAGTGALRGGHGFVPWPVKPENAVFIS